MARVTSKLFLSVLFHDEIPRFLYDDYLHNRSPGIVFERVDEPAYPLDQSTGPDCLVQWLGLFYPQRPTATACLAMTKDLITIAVR